MPGEQVKKHFCELPLSTNGLKFIFVSMKTMIHKVYIGTMALMIMAALAYMVYSGFSYYSTSLEERFYHPDYDFFKPSGIVGHGLGILGSLLMLTGVSVYMVRKRMRSMARIGRLKHWLELHIFLCILGPLLVLFHTSFKFGGLVSVSFWSMVAVFISGILGRFIYVQIPRSIEGRELSLNEIRGMKSSIDIILKNSLSLNQESIETILGSTRNIITPNHFNPIGRYFRKYREDHVKVRRLKMVLRKNRLSRIQRSGVVKLVKNELSLNNRIERLQTMQNLFKYWHVAHLPFAFLMLFIMVVHVAVTIIFGYKWIF